MSVCEEREVLRFVPSRSLHTRVDFSSDSVTSSFGSFLEAKKIFTQMVLNTVYSRRELAYAKEKRCGMDGGASFVQVNGIFALA
jgi:hypothetical protein